MTTKSTLKIRISPNAIIQYLLLFLFIICHDATIYRENTLLWREIIIVCCLIYLIVSNKFMQIPVVPLIFMAIILMYVEIRGGTKLTLSYLEHILVFSAAYLCNRYKFPERFVNFIMFYAVVSLPFYFVGIFSPNLLLKLIPFKTSVLWSNWGIDYFVQGRFLYTVRRLELERNNSIFTEPGIYQIFLNSALFIILFMPNKLYSFTTDRIRKCMIILIVCIVTTGSTTGYIGLAIIIFFYMAGGRRKYIKELNVRRKEKSIKKFATAVIILSVGAVIANYVYRGNDSLIYRFAIQKIAEMFTGGTSGHARTSMIGICMEVALKNPFGIGEEATAVLLKTMDDGANGGILVHSFASLGVIPTLCLVGLFFACLFKRRVPVVATITIILLYLNTALAQSRLLYPALIMLPVIYMDSIKNSLNVGRKTFQLQDKTISVNRAEIKQ